MSLNSQKNFGIPLLVSCALHGVLLLLFWRVQFAVLAPQEPTDKAGRLVVDQITPEMLKKIRQVGTADGVSDYFQPKKQKYRVRRKSNNLKLKSLGKLDQLNKLKKIQQPTADMSQINKPKPKTRLKRRSVDEHSVQVTERIKQKYASQPHVDPNVMDALGNADFNIKFDPPKGISEDELNKIEQIFYGFRTRMYEGYVSSFLRSMYEFKYSHPNFNIYQNLSDETLTGRVTFDRDGNIVSIKVIRWSKDDQIQELFLNTLKGIRSLPNPPKAFIEEQETFNIYYHLILRGRRG